jgi:hypothetical protein
MTWILIFILHEGRPRRHRDGVKIQQILQAEKEDEEGNMLPTRITKSTLPRRNRNGKERQPATAVDTDIEDEDFTALESSSDESKSDDEHEVDTYGITNNEVRLQ